MTARQESRQSASALYGVIVVDPPWKTSNGQAHGGNGTGFAGGNGRSTPLDYDTMSVTEIACLPVPALAADDCALYLWTINAYVEDAYRIARVWGFQPSTLLTWAKNPMGTGLGGAYRLCTEHVLYARRGQPVENEISPRNWWNWKRPYMNGKPRHSAKPDAFQDMVQSMHEGGGAMLEMFARRDRLGWDTWGNESLGTVELADLTAEQRHLQAAEYQRQLRKVA